MCEKRLEIVNPHYRKLAEIFKMPVSAYRHQKDFKIVVPCGHCPECLKRRAKSWFSRAHYLMESLDIASKDCYFCTFSLKPEVYEEVKNEPYLAIRRFLDRLRKHPRLREKNPETGRYRYRKVKFPYFFVIEFADGSTAKKRGLSSTYRMHFHAILFDCPLYPYEVEQSWRKHMGIADVQRCDTQAGIVYVLKYISKDNSSNQYISDVDARKNGKLFVSHGFGRLLSKDYSALRNHMNKSDSSYFSFFIGNYRYPIPKYWKNKVFSDNEVKERNQKVVPKLLYDQIFVHPLNEYRSLNDAQKWDVYTKSVLPFLDDVTYQNYLQHGIDVLKSKAEQTF